MPKNIYKQGDGFIIVFSVSNHETFKGVRDQLQLINDHSKMRVPIILVGSSEGEPEAVS